MSADGWSEEAATADSITLGGLTMGGNIDMNSAGKIVNLTSGTTAGDALAYGQAGSLASLSITSGGDITVSGGGELTGLPSSPSGDTAAASKAYVDSVAQGLDVHESVVCATTTAGTLASDFENGDIVDGVELTTGDRILIKNQASGVENGIYIVAASGAPARATDWASGYEAAGAFCFVEEGTANADSGWVCTNDGATDTTGTDALTFSQFSGAGQITAGDGLTKTGNTLDVGAGDGIAVGADTVAVSLATTPGLEFSSGDLQVKVSGDKGIVLSANGVEIEIDDTPDTLDVDADGLKVVGLPSLFKINDVAVGATVTAANLDDLTDGSNADSLHTHTGATNAQNIENTFTATETVVAGDPVYWDGTSGQFGKAQAGTDAKAYVFGVAEAGISASASGIIVSYGKATSVLSSATPGDLYYLGASGGLTTTIPSAGNRVILVGWAITASDLWVQPIDYGKKAA